MSRPIRIKDLKDQVGMTGPCPFLRCPKGHCEVSANTGDYFAADPSTVLRCDVCKAALQLVIQKTIYEEVEP